MNKKENKQKNKGFSLIEVLIYLSALMVVLFIVINSLMLMTDSYANLKLNQKMNQTATSILERVVVETRWSSGLNASGNIFNVDSGALALNVLDEEGDITVFKFYLDGTDLKMQKGLDPSINLNLPNIEVDKFLLKFASTGKSDLIKIELQLSAERKGNIKTETFYTSVVMRESY